MKASACDTVCNETQRLCRLGDIGPAARYGPVAVVVVHIEQDGVTLERLAAAGLLQIRAYGVDALIGHTAGEQVQAVDVNVVLDLLLVFECGTQRAHHVACALALQIEHPAPRVLQ